MKRLFKFKYPKIAMLFICIIFAYWLFSKPAVVSFVSNLGLLSYLGTFIAGILFAFGFTAPISVGFFIMLNPSNILLTAIIGGLGAACSDLLIFFFVKISFSDEIKKLKKSNFIRMLKKETKSKQELIFSRNLTKKINHYVTYLFAGFLIASPLPDEFGMTMLASLKHINPKTLALIAFLLNSAGILVLLLI